MWEIDSVKEECWARRAKDRARHYIDNPNYYYYLLHPLLQNVLPAPIWNRKRGKRHYLPPSYINSNNLSHYSLFQNIPPAPVWNREREERCYTTPLYVSANLNEAITNLHWWQQVNQVQMEPMAQINEMIIK